MEKVLRRNYTGGHGKMCRTWKYALKIEKQAQQENEKWMGKNCRQICERTVRYGLNGFTYKKSQTKPVLTPKQEKTSL